MPSPRCTHARGVAVIATLSSLAATLMGCGGPPRVPDGSAQVLKPVNRAPAGARALRTSADGSDDFRVERHDGLVPSDLIPLPWTAVGVRQASDEIRMSWEYGACGDPDFHVYVDQSPERLIIDVWYHPSNRFGGCESIGLSGSATVKLSAPLGRRPLLKHRIEPPLTT